MSKVKISFFYANLQEKIQKINEEPNYWIGIAEEEKNFLQWMRIIHLRKEINWGYQGFSNYYEIILHDYEPGLPSLLKKLKGYSGKKMN